MGANNSVSALLKVAEGIAIDGISAKTGAPANSVLDISSEAAKSTQIFIEYEKAENSPFTAANKKPTPKGLDIAGMSTFFIVDPDGVDARNLKNIAKTEVAGSLFNLQKDKNFCKWVKDLNKYTSECDASTTSTGGGGAITSAFDSDVTPASLANVVNSVLEMYLTPEAVWALAASACEYPDIKTVSISIKDSTKYPIDLYDYARQSVQHAYVANIAGFLLETLEQNSATAFIADEMYKSAESSHRMDSVIFLVLMAMLIALVIIGGYSIYTVVVNESHHASAIK